jgi:acetyl-CoA synthetase
MTYNHSAYRWVFGIKEESVYWCTADVGWVTGHSSIVYGPLSHAAAIVMYEGAPDYPTVERWWDIVEKYGVSIFYTSPTAVRMFMKYGEEHLLKHDLSSLELLGSVGEPINPEAWHWFYKYIGQERCPIVDTWWQTETGGTMLSPTPGIEPLPLKPGSATLPLPGIDAAVLDAEGSELPLGETGHLVIRKPWPGMLLDVYGDSQRYKDSYWSRFPGVYNTGDFAMRDEDGYFWLLGRADEVLKIAGHRIGTAEVEDAVVSHPAVAEAAVASRPDEVKGETIVLFVTLKEVASPSPDLKKEIASHIRKVIGAIATPDEINFVQALPKTRSGKIMRRVLKAVAAGQSLGDLTTLEDECSVEEIQKAYQGLRGSARGDSGGR